MADLINRIVVATDFSACAARAYDYALFLASSCGASLDLLSVLEFQPGMNPEYPVNSIYLGQLRKEADRNLDLLIARASQANLTVQKHVVLGIPSQRISALAEECGDDLIVMGTHGRTGLEHVLLGSTAERVIRVAPCPVLSVGVPKGAGAAPIPAVSAPITIERILVPIDLSDCSLDALEYAIQIARQFGAALTILHVIEPVAYGLDLTLSHQSELKKQKEYLSSRLTELISVLRAEGLTANHELRGGLPADSLLDYVKQHHVDLIIMGTHGRRGIAHTLSGSVAGAVLRRSPCPVLTVHSPKFRPGHRRVVSAAATQPANR